jgi:hypothetical protein
MSGMSKPKEHHQTLRILVGNWVGQEKLAASPVGAAERATGRINARLDLGGFFVLEDYSQERDGQTVFRGHGIFGWDDHQMDYIWYWVDSMGSVPASPAHGKWEGDTLLFEAGTQGRYTYQFTGDNSMHFTIGNPPDGGNTWATFMEANYRRA